MPHAFKSRFDSSVCEHFFRTWIFALSVKKPGERDESVFQSTMSTVGRSCGSFHAVPFEAGMPRFQVFPLTPHQVQRSKRHHLFLSEINRLFGPRSRPAGMVLRYLILALHMGPYRPSQQRPFRKSAEILAVAARSDAAAYLQSVTDVLLEEITIITF
jgi:hypothetical protein